MAVFQQTSANFLTKCGVNMRQQFSINGGDEQTACFSRSRLANHSSTSPVVMVAETFEGEEEVQWGILADSRELVHTELGHARQEERY